jgi:sulfur relay (sulfurtransferase) DsrF/TusC family protein
MHDILWLFGAALFGITYSNSVMYTFLTDAFLNIVNNVFIILDGVHVINACNTCNS